MNFSSELTSIVLASRVDKAGIFVQNLSLPITAFAHNNVWIQIPRQEPKTNLTETQDLAAVVLMSIMNDTSESLLHAATFSNLF